MKQLALLITVATFMVSCATEPSYVISGTLEGGNGETVLLQKREGSGIVVLDSAVLENETFVISGGSVDYPEQVQLTVRGKRGGIIFYLENNDIVIDGHIDSLQNVTVSGSVTHSEMMALNDRIAPVNERLTELAPGLMAARQDGDAETFDAISKEMDEYRDQMREINFDFLRNNPGSYHAPIVLRGYLPVMSLEEATDYLDNFTPEVADSEISKELRTRVENMKAVAIGNKAPDFTLNDTEGNPVSLYSQLGPELLFLDFWAAWCGPCRRANPDKVRTFNDFNDKGFEVFAVSLDREREDWLEAIEEDNLTWTHVSDLNYWDSKAAKLYAVNSIPASFLLDKNGVILAVNLRGDALYDKVEELLGDK